MTKRLLIVGFLILSVLVLSCGPTAGPGDADGASCDSAEAQPTPTESLGIYPVANQAYFDPCARSRLDQAASTDP